MQSRSPYGGTYKNARRIYGRGQFGVKSGGLYKNARRSRNETEFGNSGAMLNYTEKLFFDRLKTACADTFDVQYQVAVSQLVGGRSMQSVDFVISSKSTKPLLVIEIDGPHHLQIEQMEKDVYKDSRLFWKGIPVKRIPVKNIPSDDELQAVIEKIRTSKNELDLELRADYEKRKSALESANNRIKNELDFELIADYEKRKSALDSTNKRITEPKNTADSESAQGQLKLNLQMPQVVPPHQGDAIPVPLDKANQQEAAPPSPQMPQVVPHQGDAIPVPLDKANQQEAAQSPYEQVKKVIYIASALPLIFFTIYIVFVVLFGVCAAIFEAIF